MPGRSRVGAPSAANVWRPTLGRRTASPRATQRSHGCAPSPPRLERHGGARPAAHRDPGGSVSSVLRGGPLLGPTTRIDPLVEYVGREVGPTRPGWSVRLRIKRNIEEPLRRSGVSERRPPQAVRDIDDAGQPVLERQLEHAVAGGSDGDDVRGYSDHRSGSIASGISLERLRLQLSRSSVWCSSAHAKTKRISRRQAAVDHLKRVDPDLGLEFVVLRVKMRRLMIVEVHHDHEPLEATDCRLGSDDLTSSARTAIVSTCP